MHPWCLVHKIDYSVSTPPKLATIDTLEYLLTILNKCRLCIMIPYRYVLGVLEEYRQKFPVREASQNALRLTFCACDQQAS